MIYIFINYLKAGTARHEHARRLPTPANHAQSVQTPKREGPGQGGRRWLRALLYAAGCLIPGLLPAQGFDLDWFAVVAGGGTSAGGDYVLTASVGQPFGGMASSANYDATAGFAGLFESLEPASQPGLRIAPADANSVLITWPASTTGWVLQESSSLGHLADWTDVRTRVVANGTDNIATLPIAAGNRFYRLRHP